MRCARRLPHQRPSRALQSRRFLLSDGVTNAEEPTMKRNYRPDTRYRFTHKPAPGWSDFFNGLVFMLCVIVAGVLIRSL